MPKTKELTLHAANDNGAQSVAHCAAMTGLVGLLARAEARRAVNAPANTNVTPKKKESDA